MTKPELNKILLNTIEELSRLSAIERDRVLKACLTFYQYRNINDLCEPEDYEEEWRVKRGIKK